MTLGDLLSRGRAQFEAHLAGSWRRGWTSPVTYGLDAKLRARLAEVARGTVLDVGCGVMPYRGFLEAIGVKYVGLDLVPRIEGVELLGDVQDLSAIAECTFDTILCSEVLEHVPDLTAALRELNRVIKPGGYLVLSMPFLARLHEEPHDYQRLTRYGLRRVLDQNGFVVESLEETGGLFSFLGHQPATVILAISWYVPLLRQAMWGIVALAFTWVARALDKVTANAARFPAGYVVVAHRPPHGATPARERRG